MSFLTTVSDKLTNLVSGLGSARDKASGLGYAFTPLDDATLNALYRTSWLPRKIIDIPALDSCRKWRGWQAKKGQIELIEATEKRINVRAKVREAMIAARLYGGSAIYIATTDRDVSQPLDVSRVRRDGLLYLNLMSKHDLSADEIESDPTSPRYGKPTAYRIGRNQLLIHHSRLAIFSGAEIPAGRLTSLADGWGDSVLQAIMDAVDQSNGTNANVASLVYEAKVDVLKIPEFMANIGDPQYVAKVLERARLAAQGKGINGTLLMDKEEEYESKSASFGGLPDVMDRFLQAVAGAADIPATRLLGQSPAGLNATGESDLRNYYDRIQSMQELDLSPAMELMDECIIRSALGTRPPEVHYVWKTLWQPTAAEKSENDKRTAETIKTLRETQLWPDDVMSVAATTLLVENGVMPGIEGALLDYAAENPDEEETAPATPSADED